MKVTITWAGDGPVPQVVLVEACKRGWGTGNPIEFGATEEGHEWKIAYLGKNGFQMTTLLQNALWEKWEMKSHRTVEIGPKDSEIAPALVRYLVLGRIDHLENTMRVVETAIKKTRRLFPSRELRMIREALHERLNDRTWLD